MKKFTIFLAAFSVASAFALGAGDKAAAGKRAAKKRNPEELFKKLDTNNDGSVSLDEFKSGPRAKRNPDKVDQFFKRRDKDGNGSLSAEELKGERRKKKKV